MKVARVLRIIEYVGEPAWVEDCIKQRKIKGQYDCPKGYITEAIIGSTPEILEYSAMEAAAEALVNQKVCPDCGGGRKDDPTLCRTCGGRAYVSAITDFDETVDELSREIGKALRKGDLTEAMHKGDGRLGAEESAFPLCACGHGEDLHRVGEYQCVARDCDCPKFVSS